MSTSNLLKECETNNIMLWVVNDRLHYRAPKGSMTDVLKKQLKTHKPELIQILSAELPVNYYDKHVEAAIAEFNSRGISIMDLPEIKRTRASKLNQEMTEAANNNDRKAFLKALREWRQCFH